MKMNLCGDMWTLKGWMRYQWELAVKMETGVVSVPSYGPFPASVPGGLHNDLRRAGVIEDWDYGLNSLKSEWIEHREWSYEREFTLPAEMKDDDIILHFDGLDFSGHVTVNGTVAMHFKGMHKRFECNITPYCKKDGVNKLLVLFNQPPEVDALFGYTSRKSELKSRFNYTWDWCPRIVNTGIWRDVYIESYSKARITDFYPKAISADGENKVDISVEADFLEPGDYTYKFTLSKDGIMNSCGEQTFSVLRGGHTEGFSLVAENVALWYPINFGDQPLYDIKAELYKGRVLVTAAEKRIGFRQVVFTENEGSKNALAYTCAVNGRKMFLHGVNWTPISPIYGAVTRDDYVRYLSAFKNANVNIIRVWGGAILESEAFYDLCDEYGILIWQEFTQSSSGIDNTPCEDKDFIEDLVSVAREHILRRRHHTCHAVWCGGNELMWDNATPVDFRSRNIASLKAWVDALDSGKYMLPASPSGNFFVFKPERVGECFNHDIHGPWDYLGPVEHYRINNINDSLFNSEVGCTAFPRLETLEKYKGEFSVWPPDESNPYYMHRGAWWVRIAQLTGFFGEFAADGSDAADYTRASRYIQAESLGYSAQAARRNWPRCAGFIVWAGNEPYANTSNCSVLEYDGTAKPGYYRLKSAYAPIDVSAVYEKIAWKSGETFTATVGAVSEKPVAGLTVSAQIVDAFGKVLTEKTFDGIEAAEYKPYGEITFDIDHPQENLFFLRLRGLLDGCVVSSTDYTFTADDPREFAPVRNLKATTLSVLKEAGRYTVTNTGDTVAVGVFAFVRAGDKTVNVDNGYTHIYPGEQIVLTPQEDCDGEFVLDGMNIIPG